MTIQEMLGTDASLEAYDDFTSEPLDPAFSRSQITDAKRIVRGEHYRYCNALLRSTTPEPSPSFRALLIAGEGVDEDVHSAAAAMKRAHITVIDRDPAAIAAARQCKRVNAIVCDDLFSYETRSRTGLSAGKYPPRSLMDLPKFDLINLDLCCVVTDKLKQLIRIYQELLCGKGSLIACTFSYGRDAAPFFAAKTWGVEQPKLTGDFSEAWSATLAGRLIYLTPSSASIESVLLYPGRAMPMCSVVWSIKTRQSTLASDGITRRINPIPWSPRMSFAKVGDHDLRMACLADVSLSDLYATPVSRISAWKAVRTRTDK